MWHSWIPPSYTSEYTLTRKPQSVLAAAGDAGGAGGLLQGLSLAPWISHCVVRLAAPPSWVGMNHHFVKPGVKDSLSWVAAQLCKASDLSGEGVGGRSGLEKKGSSEHGIHVFSICPPPPPVVRFSPFHPPFYYF